MKKGPNQNNFCSCEEKEKKNKKRKEKFNNFCSSNLSGFDLNFSFIQIKPLSFVWFESHNDTKQQCFAKHNKSAQVQSKFVSHFSKFNKYSAGWTMVWGF